MNLRARANVTDFTRWLAAERGLTFGDYHALWWWSVTDLEGFWGRSGITAAYSVRAAHRGPRPPGDAGRGVVPRRSPQLRTKMEVPVRRILCGTPPGEAANRNAMANPASLDVFAEYARTQRDYPAG